VTWNNPHIKFKEAISFSSKCVSH